MKSRLSRIDITNFKAFREFTLNLEGRDLLVYGLNGSGKSSLYWALYTFLQSARKTKKDIEKYFDPDNDERLLNYFEQKEIPPRPGKISLTLRDMSTSADSVYSISYADHGTYKIPVILNGDLASDFITYRFFFGFSDFKNSDDFNIWPLFEQEILPFCVATGTSPGELEDRWSQLQLEPPNPNRYRGTAGAKAYRDFNQKLSDFTDKLIPVVDDISNAAQNFYDEHFAEGDQDKITLKLKVTSKAHYSQSDSILIPPILRFGIQVGRDEVKKPQSYLNEAKMTQFALSVRFAASRVNLHGSDLKLLVLDDLLVSLDMSNRMKVVEILLGDPLLADYQKIILTHDRGLFEEFRRMIGAAHINWCFRMLNGNPKDGIEHKEEKNALQKAADYINGYDLEAAALQLRKAAEETANCYLKMATGRAAKPGEFHTLSEKLEKAKRILLNQLPIQMFKNACSDVPKAHRDKLVRLNDDDIDSDGSLTPDEKIMIKQNRDRLRQFMSNEAWKVLESIDILDSVIQMKDRVLNPSAHWAETPYYKAEVEKALTLISRLKAVLIK